MNYYWSILVYLLYLSVVQGEIKFFIKKTTWFLIFLTYGSLEPSFSLPFDTNCKMYFPLEFMKIFYFGGKCCSFPVETVDHRIIWVTNIKSIIKIFAFSAPLFLSFQNLNRKQKKLELSFQDIFFTILHYLGRRNICWIKSINIH